MDSGMTLTFIIVSFAFALILIMKRDTIPPQLKRPMALLAIFLIAVSFVLIVYSLLQAAAGSGAS